MWIDPRCWVYWAVLLLILPVNWLAAALAAAGVHELFHGTAIVLLGGQVQRIRIMPLGAVMEVQGIWGGREALCALAGPMGSFLLLLFLRRFPMLGLCGLVQGVFNLLPLYPLDGGRILRAIGVHFPGIRKRP